MKLDFDVVVVGAGIAGMTAAIYLKRANINVVMIENNAPGGQINKTNLIENYPGFNKIDGPTLAFNVFQQTQSLSIPYKYGKVLNVETYDDYKEVHTDKEVIRCKAVIIATGRKSKELGLENEKSLINKGISWCALCDAPLYKEKDVAVVGSNKEALEETILLSDICLSVTLISDIELKGDLLNKVRSISNIHIKEGYSVVSLNSLDSKLNSIDIVNKNEMKENIKVAGLFIYIGNVPATDMLKNLNVNMQDDYIVVDENMRTNVRGIYACGDVIRKEVYQISTAVGEGARAAMSMVKDYN